MYMSDVPMSLLCFVVLLGIVLVGALYRIYTKKAPASEEQLPYITSIQLDPPIYKWLYVLEDTMVLVDIANKLVYKEVVIHPSDVHKTNIAEKIESINPTVAYSYQHYLKLVERSKDVLRGNLRVPLRSPYPKPPKKR